MLVLPIKKKWFDMILSGEKKEEYREIKQYYTSRFERGFFKYGSGKVLFRNGYSKNSPQFIAEVSLSIGIGNPDWGAEPNETYYKLKIIKIMEVE